MRILQIYFMENDILMVRGECQTRETTCLVPHDVTRLL